MIKYVVGFLFSPEMDKVVLIEKTHPDWQKGLLNGVGGKIEMDEEPNICMIREFEEEAGLKIDNWIEFADIIGKDYICHFFYSLSEKIFSVTTKTDEQIVIVDTLKIQFKMVDSNV